MTRQESPAVKNGIVGTKNEYPHISLQIEPIGLIDLGVRP